MARTIDRSTDVFASRGGRSDGVSMDATDGSPADPLLDKAEQVANAALPLLDRGLDQAQSLIDQGMLVLQDSVDNLRAKADEVVEQVETYTRREPLNALLIAAGVGAGLMLLLSLSMRRD